MYLFSVEILESYNPCCTRTQRVSSKQCMFIFE
jgi:hypothetical protein